MKVLVTGAAGFIGFHLVKALLQEGHQVVGLDNINDYYDVRLKYARLAETGIPEHQVQEDVLVSSNIHHSYRFIKTDLENKASLELLFHTEQFDKVVHLAAQAGVRYSLKNPNAYINSNVVGFVNILETCRHHSISHLIYASSSSVYGMSEKLPLSTDDRVDQPISLYAATKKSNELMAYTYSHLFGLKTTGLRFFTVYGPWGRPDMAPSLFANAILEDKPIKVFNHGNMVRDFTYISDIINGVLRIIQTEPHHASQEKGVPTNLSYKLYNIGKGSPVKLLDFIEALELRLGKNAKKEMLPTQPGDVLMTLADVSALQTDFGYQPSVDIQKGVKYFIEWFLKYKKNKL